MHVGLDVACPGINNGADVLALCVSARDAEECVVAQGLDLVGANFMEKRSHWSLDNH